HTVASTLVQPQDPTRIYPLGEAVDGFSPRTTALTCDLTTNFLATGRVRFEGPCNVPSCPGAVLPLRRAKVDLVHSTFFGTVQEVVATMLTDQNGQFAFCQPGSPFLETYFVEYLACDDEKGPIHCGDGSFSVAVVDPRVNQVFSGTSPQDSAASGIRIDWQLFDGGQN